MINREENKSKWHLNEETQGVAVHPRLLLPLAPHFGQSAHYLCDTYMVN